MAIPVVLIFILGLFGFLIWGAAIISKVEHYETWKSQTLIWALAVALTIYLPCKAYNDRPYVEVQKEVTLVNNQAVISEGDTIVQLSKITGESYKTGDWVRFKVYAEKHNYFDFCQTWKDRCRDFETILHKAD